MIYRTALASTRQRLIAGLHCLLPRSRAHQDWGPALDRVINDLVALNRATERDFLAIGDKLSVFRSTARQISADMLAIAELFSGEHGQNVAEALRRSLADANHLAQGISARCDALTRVSEFSENLRRAFSTLPNTISAFTALCTLTRIETAHVGGDGADLGHLAEEVRPLSEAMLSAGQHALDVSQALDQQVRSAIDSGNQFRRTQLTNIPAVIATVSDSLQALEQGRRLALESSTRQSSQYAAVCDAIDDLVGSIQFHDITRQQVEHAIEVLRQVRSAQQDRGTGAARADDRTVLMLQSLQLSEAADTFVATAERMERDLSNIAELLKNASESARSLTEHSNQKQTSYFAKLEKQISAILKILETCQSAESQINGAAGSLAETVARMQASVHEIRGTEIQIQRISTNATIRAVHIGAPGVALNKIAEIMQRMALDSNASTEAISETLEAMLAAGARVSQPDAKSGEGAINNLGEDVRRAAMELHLSSQASFERVTEIAALASQLAADITAILTSFSVARTFAETIDRARTELKSMGAGDGPVSVQNLCDDAVEHLENFAKTYTMQKQRDVHARILGPALMPASPLAASVIEPGPAESGSSEFGANVDLF